MPFYRSSDAGSPHEGSGLGLAIAKGFVNAGGGDISVESLPGQGTSFVVELPVDMAAPDPEASDAASEAQPTGSAEVAVAGGPR